MRPWRTIRASHMIKAGGALWISATVRAFSRSTLHRSKLPTFSSKWRHSPARRVGRILSLGTLTLYRSAINKRYMDANKASPTAHFQVRVVLKGLARLRGGASRQVKALREHHIAAMLRVCPDTLIGRRDAAFLAIGFAAALRRSELCNLKVDDIEWEQGGLPGNDIQESSSIFASRRPINWGRGNGSPYRKGRRSGRLLAYAVGYRNPESRRDICFRRCEKTVL